MTFRRQSDTSNSSETALCRDVEQEFPGIIAKLNTFFEDEIYIVDQSLSEVRVRLLCSMSPCILS